MNFNHVSVLLREVIEGLNIRTNGIYVDCTLGGAGHSSVICENISCDGKIIGIDQDENALRASRIKLKEYIDNVTFVHDNFKNIDKILNNLNIEHVDGILMDLGVSSYQLDTADRGFSYRYDSKLDMRMNQNNAFSAYDLVNTYSQEDLKRIIKDYGEERFANNIAKRIVECRKKKSIETTGELADIIKMAVPKSKQETKHPAKRTFQAIRIEVNGELEILKKTIGDSVSHLRKGGRLCIITFHSLEDRIVKETFKELEKPCTCPKEFPICICGKKTSIKIITKKPIIPSEEEVNFNPRSRSAKLRIIEKIV